MVIKKFLWKIIYILRDELSWFKETKGPGSCFEFLTQKCTDGLVCSSKDSYCAPGN